MNLKKNSMHIDWLILKEMVSGDFYISIFRGSDPYYNVGAILNFFLKLLGAMS
jgi:hypothetical protein